MTALHAAEPMALPLDHAALDAPQAARPELGAVDGDTGRRDRRASRRHRIVREVSVLLEARPVLGGVSGVADVVAEVLAWSVSRLDRSGGPVPIVGP